jgi:hypothetical protein
MILKNWNYEAFDASSLCCIASSKQHRFQTRRFQTSLIQNPIWIQTYLISNLSDSIPIWLPNYLIPNLSDSELIWSKYIWSKSIWSKYIWSKFIWSKSIWSKPYWFWTYLTLNLFNSEPTVSDSKPIWSHTLTLNLSDTELNRYRTCLGLTSLGHPMSSSHFNPERVTANPS